MNIIELKDHKENSQQENINEYLRRDENIAEIKKIFYNRHSQNYAGKKLRE